MRANTQVTSIILAGGQGSRLYPLTKYRSKPAVPLGGKFRLIDIPISNCLHADIRYIWVVTQFSSESLHRHIFSTYRMEPFDTGFISILAASQTVDNKGWYQGTADAVRKNLSFFKDAHPNIMILSGDHLYKMDYRKFLDFHLAQDADITVAALPVSKNRISEFGVLKANDTLQITDFAEKPKEDSKINSFTINFANASQCLEDFNLSPEKPYLASMGIYIFKKQVLFKMLENTEYRDFGKDIFPQSIKQHKVIAYPFSGYWEDIGTIKAFFNTQLALTDTAPSFNFHDVDNPIFTRARFLPAAKIQSAQITNAIVAEGSVIEQSTLNKCVIGIRSIIRSGCDLEKVVMMGSDYYENLEDREKYSKLYAAEMGIGKNTVIKNAIIDKNARIGNNVQLINKDHVQEGEIGEIVIKDGIIVVPKTTVIPDGFVL